MDPPGAQQPYDPVDTTVHVNAQTRSAALLHATITPGTQQHMTSGIRDPYSRGNRWLMYMSSLCVMVACSSLTFTTGHHWSWPLFVWGLAMGPAAIVGYEALVKVVMAAFRLTAAEVAQARDLFKSRKQALYPSLPRASARHRLRRPSQYCRTFSGPRSWSLLKFWCRSRCIRSSSGVSN